MIISIRPRRTFCRLPCADVMAAFVLLPSVLTLLAGGHQWTTREWLETSVGTSRRPSCTAEYAEGLRVHVGPITFLALCDVSDGHVVEGASDGRALSANGIELQCLVVSGAFKGVARIARQQRVQSFFQADLASGSIHALAMRCWTPDEWQANGSPRTYADAVGKTPSVRRESIVLHS